MSFVAKPSCPSSFTLAIRPFLLRLVVHHSDRHGTAVLACDLLLLAVHRVMRLEKELQNVGVEADSQVPRDLAQVVDRVRNRRVPLSTECRIPLALVVGGTAVNPGCLCGRLDVGVDGKLGEERRTPFASTARARAVCGLGLSCALSFHMASAMFG